MNKITLILADADQFRKNLMASFDDGVLKTEYHNNFQHWEPAGIFYSDLDGEEACEYAFELSNNPRMQNERKLIQGKSRSLSVGDMIGITVIEEDGFESYSLFMCMNDGWEQIL